VSTSTTERPSASPATRDWLGLRGRTAIVAGAGGLGGATARALAVEGADVVVLDVDRERLDLLAESTRGCGRSLATVAADLGSAAGCRVAIDDTLARFGPPQVFVHAIGRNTRVPVLDVGDDDWASIIELNLSTAFWLGRAVGGAMVASGVGRMAFISSASGWLAHPDHGPYAASKGGLNQLVRVMAREWAPHGVTVNAVAPGYVETDLTRDHLDGGHRGELVSLVPAGRLGTPEEVADAVTFLVSDRARFVTGHVLWVDGGRSLV
jgi:gluconate 5-dehydrogenase